MPLSEKARVEVYVPDLPEQPYQDLLIALEQEFTYIFRGCTVLRGLSGNYLAHSGWPIQDRINLLYTDTFFSIADNFSLLSDYADRLRIAAFQVLREEAILIVVIKVYHSE